MRCVNCRSYHEEIDVTNTAAKAAPALKNSLMMGNISTVSQTTNTLPRSAPPDYSCDNPMSTKKNLRNYWVSPQAPGICWFDDTYRGGVRLNILGDGSIDPEGKGQLSVWMKGQLRLVDGVGLRYLSQQRQPQQDYTSVRVIAHDSACGENPLGQQVANAFNLETKAFQGFINAPSVDAIQKMKFDAAFKSAIGSRIDLNQVLEKNKTRFVERNFVTDPKKLAHWTGYNPVTFMPA